MGLSLLRRSAGQHTQQVEAGGVASARQVKWPIMSWAGGDARAPSTSLAARAADPLSPAGRPNGPFGGREAII